MIYISQDLVRNPELTNYDIATWCFADIITYSPLKDFEVLCAQQIVCQICGTIEVAHSIEEGVSQSLRRLVEKGILHGERLNKSLYKVYKDSFNKTKHFIKVEEENIRTIFLRHKRPFAVLRHYLLMLSTIDERKKYGTWKNETLASVLGQEEQTITAYNNVLENLELLYIYRGMYSSNTYGRYEDKDVVIAAGKARSKGKTISLSSNYKRRMTQIYNQMRQGNPKYTNDPMFMDEVYTFCSRMNEQPGEKKYDLSIFA